VTDLLRLDRLAVEGTRSEDGCFIITVRSKAPSFPQCCLLCTPKKLGTKAIRFRDYTIQADPVWLEVKRQRFKCLHCNKISYEDLPDFDSDFRLTVRFRDHLVWQAIDLPFTTAASQNGVHETLIRRLFAAETDRMLSSYQPYLPRVLGMDEIYLHRKARFVIGDVENGRMLDMQPSRRDADLRAYFDGLLDRHRVEVVCQDMWTGYRSLTKAMFPKAVTVIDKYHVQRTANYGMEVVRKALYLGLSNKDRVALKRKRALFMARNGGSTAAAQEAMAKVFAVHPGMQRAYDLKEQFYDIYEAPDRAAAEAATDRWLASVPPEFERPFKPSIDALRNWRPHILRYFEHRFTSGYVERLNGLIRKMDRNGAGYSYEVLRAKALFKHGALTLRKADGSIPFEMLGPDDDDLMPGDVWLWSGGEMATLEADLDAGEL
jgi:transposase